MKKPGSLSGANDAKMQEVLAKIAKSGDDLTNPQATGGTAFAGDIGSYDIKRMFLYPLANM
jgi:hypothetical protein